MTPHDGKCDDHRRAASAAADDADDDDDAAAAARWAHQYVLYAAVGYVRRCLLVGQLQAVAVEATVKFAPAMLQEEVQERE